MIIDKAKLKALAEGTKGWDNLTECWPAGESEPDWEVGAVGEDGDRYPVLTVNTDQYDAEHDAVKIAQYYAAANPLAVLALLAEINLLISTRQALVKERQAHIRQRDQLKAENAGLRTGYEAYEQVVQGLKAENEMLRKDGRAH